MLIFENILEPWPLKGLVGSHKPLSQQRAGWPAKIGFRRSRGFVDEELCLGPPVERLESRYPFFPLSIFVDKPSPKKG